MSKSFPTKSVFLQKNSRNSVFSISSIFGFGKSQLIRTKNEENRERKQNILTDFISGFLNSKADSRKMKKIKLKAKKVQSPC